MTGPLVTLGVPVFRGEDRLPALLECLRTQSYKNIDVLISVDGGDQGSAEASKPFLQQDSRFRMQLQPTRLGWAGNTDWTMRNRRGDFYIYQQHDDLLSPTYVADLVEASAGWPNAVICFSKVQFTGRRDSEVSAPSLLGDPKARALAYLRRLNWEPFRGLIRGSALDKTSGLLLSDFDPFDSFGTEWRLMAELALIGEFRYVEGPTYFKSAHAENLSDKRAGWSKEHRFKSVAQFAAWMIEVIVPVGETEQERRRLFQTAFERFAGCEGSLKWIRPVWNNEFRLLASLRSLWDQIASRLARSSFDNLEIGDFSADERVDLLRQVFEQLENGGRFNALESVNMTWEALESEILGAGRHSKSVH